MADFFHELNTDLDNAKSNIGATNTNIANLTTALSGKQDTADAVKVGIFYRTDSVGGGKSVLIDAATITGIASSRFLGVCPFLVTTNRGNGYGRIRGDAGSVNTYYIDSTHTSGEAIFHKCVYFYR